MYVAQNMDFVARHPNSAVQDARMVVTVLSSLVVHQLVVQQVKGQWDITSPGPTIGPAIPGFLRPLTPLLGLTFFTLLH